jgi:hypothetical protein
MSILRRRMKSRVKDEDSDAFEEGAGNETAVETEN